VSSEAARSRLTDGDKAPQGPVAKTVSSIRDEAGGDLTGP